MSEQPLEACAGQIVLTVPGEIRVVDPSQLPTEGGLGRVRARATAAPGRVTWATVVGEQVLHLDTFTIKETQQMFDECGL